MGNGCNDSLCNHVIKHFLNLFLELYEYLAWGMLNRENIWVCPDNVGPGHVANGVKELGEACFNAIMSWIWAVGQEEITWGNCTLRADLGQRWYTRVGLNMSLTVVDEGLLCLAPLMDEILLKLILKEVVFLMPWQLVWEGVLLCNGAASTSGHER